MSLDNKKKRTDSVNFAGNLFNLVAGLLLANGIVLSPEVGEAVQTAIVTGSILPLVLILQNLIVLGLKVYGKFTDKSFSWAYLQDPNFITQTLTTVLAGVLLFTPIPAIYVAAMIEVINGINIALHVIKDKN